jgi:hypothetical protein
MINNGKTQCQRQKVFKCPPIKTTIHLYLVFGQPKDPRSLWSKFLSAFTEDYVKKGYKVSAKSIAMRDVENIFRLHKL